MSLEIVNRALDFEKSSALFTISSDMHQSVFPVHDLIACSPKVQPFIQLVRTCPSYSISVMRGEVREGPSFLVLTC